MLEHYFVNSDPKLEFDKVIEQANDSDGGCPGIFPPADLFTALFKRLDISPNYSGNDYRNIILLSTNWHERYQFRNRNQFCKERNQFWQATEHRRPIRKALELLGQDLGERRYKSKPCLVIAERCLEGQIGEFLRDYSR